MRSRNTEETVRELNEKSKSAGISAEYKAAEINTNGKLSRELAGAVTQADFARERNRIIFGDAAQKNVPAENENGNTFANSFEGIEDSAIPFRNNSNVTGERYADNEIISATAACSGLVDQVYTESSDKEMYSPVFANESTPHPDTRSHIEDTRFNVADRAPRKSFIGNELAYSSSANSADRNAAAETRPSYSSVQGREGIKTKQILTPEQEEAARLERMNANYEHDKAVLAKTDPLFARNHFWDVGHAEGSGEVTDRDLAKLAQIKIEEEKNRLLDGGHFNEY